jgi:hypothetical protein
VNDVTVLDGGEFLGQESDGGDVKFVLMRLGDDVSMRYNKVRGDVS